MNKELTRYYINKDGKLCTDHPCPTCNSVWIVEGLYESKNFDLPVFIFEL